MLCLRRHLHSLHTTSRGSSGPRVCTHLIHASNKHHSSTLNSPSHPTSYSVYSPSISSSSCCRSISTRISSNTVYSANKEMESTDESYSKTDSEETTKRRDRTLGPRKSPGRNKPARKDESSNYRLKRQTTSRHSNTREMRGSFNAVYSQGGRLGETCRYADFLWLRET